MPRERLKRRDVIPGFRLLQTAPLRLKSTSVIHRAAGIASYWVVPRSRDAFLPLKFTFGCRLEAMSTARRAMAGIPALSIPQLSIPQRTSRGTTLAESAVVVGPPGWHRTRNYAVRDRIRGVRELRSEFRSAWICRIALTFRESDPVEMRL